MAINRIQLRMANSTWLIDAMFVLVLAIVIYAIVSFASVAEVEGLGAHASINLSPRYLPLYAAMSVGRMLAAYLLSVIFSFGYAYTAAYNKSASKFMVPLLDILQSIPLLSFMPVVVLTMIALFHNSRIGIEMAAVVLIFTSQVWNMTFSLYHSITGIPRELKETTVAFNLTGWMRFRYLEMPAATMGLVWNSMISWAGGWFFLMASEMFTLGNRSFQLPGLGSYLQSVSSSKDYSAIIYGLATLVLIIIFLDRFIWQPLVTWANKFKIEEIEGESQQQVTSPLLRLGQRSVLVRIFIRKIGMPLVNMIAKLLYAPALKAERLMLGLAEKRRVRTVSGKVVISATILVVLLGVVRAINLLGGLGTDDLFELVKAAFGSVSRVAIAIAISLTWTLPFGIWVGMNPKLSRRFQPFIQITASIPATALFPIVLLFLIDLPFGLNLAAVLLMVMAAQWYLLFNIIAGASLIPQNLKETSNAFSLRGFERWRVLVLPAIIPNLITGLITASGGAWNATIIAEYIRFKDEAPHHVTGLGATIAQAADKGDFSLLLAATLILVGIVVTINRFIWGRIHHTALEKFSMEAV